MIRELYCNIFELVGVLRRCFVDFCCFSNSREKLRKNGNIFAIMGFCLFKFCVIVVDQLITIEETTNFHRKYILALSRIDIIFFFIKHSNLF